MRVVTQDGVSTELRWWDEVIQHSYRMDLYARRGEREHVLRLADCASASRSRRLVEALEAFVRNRTGDTFDVGRLLACNPALTDPDRAVTEALRDDLRMHTGKQQQARMRVPQIVKAYRGQ